MKLSVFYDHIIEASEQCGKPTEEILNFCNEQGISAVEINFTQLIENRSSISSALSNAKLSISCIYEFFSFEKAQSNDDLVKAEKMVKLASELNVSKILIVPGTLNPFDAAELVSCSDTYEHTEIFMNNNIWDSIAEDLVKDDSHVIADKDVLLSNIELYTPREVSRCINSSL